MHAWQEAGFNVGGGKGAILLPFYCSQWKYQWKVSPGKKDLNWSTQEKTYTFLMHHQIPTAMRHVPDVKTQPKGLEQWACHDKFSNPEAKWPQIKWRRGKANMEGNDIGSFV